MRNIRIGSLIEIISDNDNYDKYREKLWIVEKISRSVKDHPGYDSSIKEALIDCKDLPFSLYEYEFHVIKY